ncbi:hypothetical protein [Rosenbergiella epipactidis]|uniref:hypothetical protein n=1 Tax=Rosenbergiella epipactidis TaxID=1544694 RepID=UPI001F4DB118|nr:hypothetical protein [Rosenbergiella epipactidis]
MEPQAQVKPLDLSTIVPAETPYTDEYFQQAATSALSQLDMVIHRCKGDDLNIKAIQNCKSVVEQVIADLNARLDHETNEYNNVLDVVEQLDSRLKESLSVIAGLSDGQANATKTLNEQLAAETDRADTLQANYDRLEIKFESFRREHEKMVIDNDRVAEIACIQMKQERAEFANYRKLVPDSLAKDNQKLQQENAKLRAERREDAKARQGTLNGSKKLITENAVLQRKLANMEVDANKLRERSLDMEHRLKEMSYHVNRMSGTDGYTEHTTKSCAGHNIACHINTFYHQSLIPLHGEFTDRDSNYGLNVHWQIRTASMIDMTVLASPWGRAIFFKLPHLEEHWNEDITHDLEGRIEATYEKEKPQLYKRLKDGENTPLSALNLSTRAENVLMANRFVTVRDVAGILTPEFKDIDGCGESMTKEIINALITWENNWSQENGAVEEYRRSKLSAISVSAELNRAERRVLKSKAKTR